MPNFLQIPIIDSRYLDKMNSNFPNGMKLSRHFKPGDMFFLDSSVVANSLSYLAYNDALNKFINASIALKTKNVFVKNDLYSKYYFCIAIKELEIIVPFGYGEGVKPAPIDSANASTNATQTLNLDDYNCTLPVVELSVSDAGGKITCRGTLDGATDLVDGLMFLAHFEKFSAVSMDTMAAMLNINDLGDIQLYRYDSPHTKNDKVNTSTMFSDIWAPIVYYSGAFYLLSNAVTFTGSGYTPPPSESTGGGETKLISYVDKSSLTNFASGNPTSAKVGSVVKFKTELNGTAKIGDATLGILKEGIETPNYTNDFDNDVFKMVNQSYLGGREESFTMPNRDVTVYMDDKYYSANPLNPSGPSN